MKDLDDLGGIGKLRSNTYGVDIDFTKIDHLRQKIFKMKVLLNSSIR